jgi:RHS repeat-associated protein
MGISDQLAKTVEGSTTTLFASTLGGQPMAQKAGSAAQTYHLLDTHSDVVGLVSTVAANQGTTAYDAYGGVLGTTGTQGALGYQGDVTDQVTKQVDMGTRFYAPGMGRFTTRDVLFGELDSPMTLNQFAYGGMNPITMWDPTGMGQCTMAGECVTEDKDGNRTAVGGNPGDSSHPHHGCSCVFTPTPPPPQPAPAVTYVREAGAYAVAVGSGCVRRCGSEAEASIDWGEDVSLDPSDECHGFLNCAGEFISRNAGTIKGVIAVGAGVGCIILTAGGCTLLVAGAVFVATSTVDVVAWDNGYLSDGELGRNVAINAFGSWALGAGSLASQAAIRSAPSTFGYSTAARFSLRAIGEAPGIVAGYCQIPEACGDS